MPGFSVDNFRAELNSKGGPLRTNRFLLTFSTPQSLLTKPGMQATNRTMEYWIDSALLPGYFITAAETRRYTYGPSEKRPAIPNFTQMICTVINDANNRNWRFFTGWQQSILPHDTSNGINTRAVDSHGGYAYELEYKQAYATDLHLYVYDVTGEERMHVTCREAFPSQIPDVTLAWTDNNNLLRFNVVFDFVDWFVERRTIF